MQSSQFVHKLTRFRPYVIACTILLSCTLFSLGHTLDHYINDLSAAIFEHKQDAPISIIAIDKRSLQSLKQWPWSRQTHAQLIEKIARAKPRSVYIDLHLDTPSSPDDDRVFAQAIKTLSQETQVLLPVYLDAPKAGEEVVLHPPLELFRQNSQLVLPLSNDKNHRVVRYFDQGLHWQNTHYLSLASTLYPKLKSQGLAASNVIDYAISSRSFNHYSYSDVLKPSFDISQLNNHHLLIGVTSNNITPDISIPNYQKIPSITLEAIALHTAQAPMQMLDPQVLSLLFVLITLLFTHRLINHSWQLAYASLIVIIIGMTCAQITLYYYGIIFNTATLSLALCLCFFVNLLFQLQYMIRSRNDIKNGLNHAQSLLINVLNSSSDYIICCNDKNEIISINQKAGAFLGIDTQHLQAYDIHNYLPDLADYQLSQLVHNKTQTYILGADERRIPVEITVSQANIDAQRLFILVIRDMSSQIAREKKLEFEASHDALTQLLNRRQLESIINQDLQTHPQNTLLLLDLDYFNEVNKSYGHATGDEILIAVSLRLRRLINKQGVCARINGDEFAIWLAGQGDIAQMRSLSEAIIKDLERPYRIQQCEIEVGACIGFGISPIAGDNVKDVLNNCDLALHEAKQKRSGIEVFNSSDSNQQKRFIELIPQLRHAIENNILEPYFQPKIDLVKEEIAGAEVLLRWPQADGGFIAPDQFIDVAENSRLITPLTQNLFNTILEREEHWRAAGMNNKLAINLSARLLSNTEFIDLLCHYNDRPTPYFEIELEVTESAVLYGKDKSLKALRKLHHAGYIISIDDYGTGYSSLSYIRDMQPSLLKIDKSFIFEINASTKKQAIVRSTINMAHELGVKVVAEGCETQADIDLLRQYKCHYAQGFFYSKAVPEQAYFEFCHSWQKQRLKCLHPSEPPAKHNELH